MVYFKINFDRYKKKIKYFWFIFFNYKYMIDVMIWDKVNLGIIVYMMGLRLFKYIGFFLMFVIYICCLIFDELLICLLL